MRNRQLQHLRRRVEQLPRGRGVRFPAELRADVTVWIAQRRAEGAWWCDLEREIGIAAATLKRWSTPREEAALALRPVEIIDTSRAATVTIVAPNGLRIEGVEVETAIAILRGLT